MKFISNNILLQYEAVPMSIERFVFQLNNHFNDTIPH